MTAREVSVLSGLTRQAVRHHDKTLVPTRAPDGSLVYDRAIVEAWVAARASNPRPSLPQRKAFRARAIGQPSKISSVARAALDRTAAARAAMALIDDEGDDL